jgi:TPR repeat protein
MRYYAEVLRDGQGVEMNQQEAARLYSAAATLGDVPSKAFLGDLYRRGIGVPAVDYEAAFRLFTEAIEAGYFQAQGDLAAMYLQGQGTEANPEKAMSLLKGGAEKGDPQCMYLYGLIIYDGAFAPPDVETGKEWLRKSANLEHPPAIQWHIDNNIPF